jgi:site-specific DNA-cytosine methylase
VSQQALRGLFYFSKGAVLKILVACEYSGAVRDAFLSLGHDAMSCDLLPTDAPGPHYQGDVRDILLDGWDLMVAHPPCTYLSVSGMHWTTRGLRDPKLTEDALEFVRVLLEAPIERIALENPVSVISSRIRKPDQIITPYQFGHDASKKTCLWLKNLPPLKPTQVIEPRIVNGKPRWGNQTDSGQNKLAPSADRWKVRSQTYSGIAQAMASQWGTPANDNTPKPANDNSQEQQ